jgi:hypothetical protein
LATKKLSGIQGIELCGKRYELTLDLWAVKEFENATGKGILQVIGPVFTALRGSFEAAADQEELIDGVFGVLDRLVATNAITAGDLVLLLWVALGGADCELSQKEVGRLVTPANAVEVGRTLFECVAAMLPKAEPTAAGAETTPEPEGNAESSTG